MDNTSAAPQFDDFWEASSFSHYDIASFARGIEAYSGTDKPKLSLTFPGHDHILPGPKNKLAKLTLDRQSQRNFSSQPMTERQLSELLASFRAVNGLEHRAFASAGAAYPLEVFMVTLNIKGDLNKRVLYYNADNHSVSVVSDAPAWKDLEPLMSIQLAGQPQCIVVFVLMTDRMTSKYSERGGRFALMEVGAAMQNLSLTISQLKLHGVPLGGLLDEPWCKVLALQNTGARIALGYACGI